MLKRAIAMSLQEEEVDFCSIRHQGMGELLQRTFGQKHLKFWFLNKAMKGGLEEQKLAEDEGEEEEKMLERANAMSLEEH